MKTNILKLNPTTYKPFELAQTSVKMPISEVFAERKGSYLNEFTLFIAHFNSIPNSIYEIGIDCKKANNWFAEHYKSEIKDSYYDKRYFNKSKKRSLMIFFISFSMI
ncbi:MAG: hypothetical protein IPH46_16625 [Bacteroidetes bacterium]|nr:hypothetical protein [Bacteroidota bacterium]